LAPVAQAPGTFQAAPAPTVSLRLQLLSPVFLYLTDNVYRDNRTVHVCVSMKDKYQHLQCALDLGRQGRN
jgi:hypothetical protein